MTAPIAEPRPLHPLQSAVVSHRGSNLVVEAPAGTGKTETLARRAVSLLDDLRFRPHQLWVCSFTRSASRSIKQRICDFSYQGQFITFGTLHSLALRVIRRHGWRIGLSLDVEVISRKKQTDLIKAFMDNLPVKLPVGVKASRLAELFSLQLNTGFSLEHLCQRDNLSVHLPSIQLVQSRLYEYQDYYGLIDYDGIIFDCIALVKQSGAFIADYDCKHLLVDEAQDMSGLQLELLATFADSGIQLTVVGDRMQSVYSWRGADPNAMMAYEKFPGNWTKLILNQNFRCPECVLQVANQISARQGGVRLYSGIAGGSASSSRFPTEQAEADVVADRVADLLKQGCAPSDIAILYRSSLHSLKLQEALKRLEIPFRKFGGLQHDSAALSHLAALLRLVLGLHVPALQQVLQLCPGIGPAKAKQMAELWPDCKIPARAAERVESLLCCVESMRMSFSPVDLWQAAADWLGECVNLDDLEQVSEVFSAGLFTGTVEGFIRDFLDDLALDVSPDQEQCKAVSLGTVHWAKGKEWPHVFVIGCTIGRFVRPGNLEDERLLFVSLTRSSDRLEISSPEFHFNGQSWLQGIPCVEVQP